MMKRAEPDMSSSSTSDPAAQSLGLNSPGRGWMSKLWWQIILFAAICYACSLSSDKLDEQMGAYLPESVMNCSTHNGKDSGYKAFYELAERCGLQTMRFEIPYRDLKKYKGIMFVAGPNLFMSDFELEQVLKWVAEGNNLVFLDYCLYGNGYQLLDKLGAKAIAMKAVENLVSKEIPGRPDMAHVHQLVLSSETRVKGGEAIIANRAGSLISEFKHGKGSCLIITSPGFCSNRRISDTSNWGNFQFLLNWCQEHGGKLIFDERVHGHASSQSLWVQLLKGVWAPAILQGIVLFLLALFCLNQRFGVPLIQQLKRKIANREFIEGMALTYRKAKAYDAAWSILYGSFHTRLYKALSLAPDEKAEIVAQNWAHAAPVDATQVLKLLNAAQSFQNNPIRSEEELLANIKECDSLYEKTKPYLSVHRARRLGA